MNQVTVVSATLVERKGNAKLTGKPYHLRIQTAYLHTTDALGKQGPFPDKFEILLDVDQAPFPPGVYKLDPSSVGVDREGRLEVKPRLAPVKTTA